MNLLQALTARAKAPPPKESPASAPTLNRAESDSQQSAITEGENPPPRKPGRPRTIVFRNEEHRAAVEALRQAAHLRDTAEKAARAFAKMRTVATAEDLEKRLAEWLEIRKRMEAYTVAKRKAQP